MFRQDGSCPALLEDLSAGFPYGAVTRYGSPFQTLPVPKTHATGLIRVRSPLLAESRLMSVPPATEMFQFAGFASCTYEFSTGYPHGWVAPFGDPGITDRSHLPRAFRSVPRPSSPLSAKASTRCPSLRLITGIPTRSGTSCRRGMPHKTAAHRGKTPARKTASHEDTSPDRHRPAGPSLSASVTLQTLSLPFKQHPAPGSSRDGISLVLLQTSERPPAHDTGGGGERDRTDDLLLAKQALSQLSYTPGQRSEIRTQRSASSDLRSLSSDLWHWWAREDLNLRPHAYQARALTS